MCNPLPIRLMAALLLFSQCIFANPILTKDVKRPFSEIKMFSTFLYTASGNMADGNRVVFDELYSNNVDMYDAVKMMNPGENFGLFRSGYQLAVEARQPISGGDTLHYSMSNLLPQVYTMVIEVQYLENTSAIAELVDRFTNTRRFIDMSTNSSFPVVVTSNPASRASNRFYLVFSAMSATLPVKFTDTKLVQAADKHTRIQWKAEEEINVKHYEIERGNNGSIFTMIGQVSKQPAADVNYHYVDRQAHTSQAFYRIVAIDADGKKTYSPVLKLHAASISATAFAIYPNPVPGTLFTLRMQDAQPGEYAYKLVNNSGQAVHSGKLKVTQASQAFPIVLNGGVAAGIYTIVATAESGEVLSKKIIVQK